MDQKKVKIEVVPYNPEWPKLFEMEAKRIQEVLQEGCIEVHHVGSTSVPGLSAKPKIDIIAVIKTGVKPISALESIGYEFRGEYNIPFQFGFSKRTEPNVNLHVFEEGNPEIQLNLIFRDYLRAHSELRDQYQTLKEALVAQEASHQKIQKMFTGYNLGKNEFIQEVLNKAGFNELCMRFCTHYLEWEMAKYFRNTYFFDKIAISDPYTWTFNHPDHIHFILYKGSKIIGYAHIQLWPEKRAALRIIVIDEPYQHLKYGRHFLSLCEKWLKNQGIKIFQMEASPTAKNFYLNNDYHEMIFNDPEGNETHPKDTPLGKFL